MERKERLTHGTIAGYKTYRCRCRKCTEVWNLYTQEFRETVYDDTKAKTKPVNIKISDRDYSERNSFGKDYR